MSAGRKRPLDEMAALADAVVALLAGVVDRPVVAGSIRRKVPEVSDLEIVCVPRLAEQPGMFADMPVVVDLLDARIAFLLEEGTLAPRPTGTRAAAMGARYRALLYRDTPLDLFSPTPEAYPVVLLIRTGPASFSRRCVTPRRSGGLMPDWMRVKDGRLFSGEVPLDLRDEADVLNALGLPWIDPWRRTGVERAPLAAVKP